MPQRALKDLSPELANSDANVSPSISADRATHARLLTRQEQKIRLRMIGHKQLPNIFDHGFGDGHWAILFILDQARMNNRGSGGVIDLSQVRSLMTQVGEWGAEWEEDSVNCMLDALAFWHYIDIWAVP